MRYVDGYVDEVCGWDMWMRQVDKLCDEAGEQALWMRQVDELCIGELSGQSVREDVLVKSYVGVSKASSEVVW